MQTIISNLPEIEKSEIEKSEIENLKRLLFKDTPTDQDLVSLKELITKYPDTKIEDHDLQQQSYLTPMGYLIFRDKLDILIESFPTELEASEKLSELKAIVFPTLYHTAIGYAIRHGSLSIFSKLAGDKKLSDILTTVFEKGSLAGHNLMAIGTAIRFNNLNDKLLELFSKKLKYGEKLSEVTAFVTPNKKYMTALEYSINLFKIDSVRLLIKRDPSFVDLKFEKLYLSADSAARFHHSALTHTKLSYNHIKEAIAKKTKEGETSDELIATREKYMSIIKILLENGARFEDDQSQYGLPIEITNEIKKIIETKKFYDGYQDLIKEICEFSTVGEIDNKINIEHLKFLFKQSGIPRHLMPDAINQRSTISIIIKEITTPEREFLNDLDSILGILNNALYPNLFPLNAGYIFLTERNTQLGGQLASSQRDLGVISDEQKTITSYEAHPHLQTKLFLQRNSESQITTMLTSSMSILPQDEQKTIDSYKVNPSLQANLLSQENKAKELFLKMSEGCILQQEMHLKIKEIRQKLLSIDPVIEMILPIINKLESQHAKTQQELKDSNAKQQERIVALESQNTKQQEEIAELKRKDDEKNKRLLILEERLSQLIRQSDGKRNRDEYSLSSLVENGDEGTTKHRKQTPDGQASSSFAPKSDNQGQSLSGQIKIGKLIHDTHHI
jgi:hypothetical protein